MKRILTLAGFVMPTVLIAQTSSNKIIVQLPKLTNNAHAYLVTDFGWDNQQLIDSAVWNKSGIRASLY
jgi:hypothetical protein